MGKSQTKVMTSKWIQSCCSLDASTDTRCTKNVHFSSKKCHMTASRAHAKQVIHVTVIQVNIMAVVVQFSSWFKFYIPLVQTHYHTFYHTPKQRKIKFKPRKKLNHNMATIIDLQQRDKYKH